MRAPTLRRACRISFCRWRTTWIGRYRHSLAPGINSLSLRGTFLLESGAGYERIGRLPKGAEAATNRPQEFTLAAPGVRKRKRAWASPALGEDAEHHRPEPSGMAAEPQPPSL